MPSVIGPFVFLFQIILLPLVHSETSFYMSEYKILLTKIQSLEIDWRTILSPSLFDIVENFSAAKGTPIAFFAIPIISMVTFAMGNGSSIQVKSSWIEPLICWLVVGAEKGTGKSPAFTALRSELSEFAKLVAVYLDSKDKFIPCLQSFTLESLFPILSSPSHQGTAMCFYDEFKQFLNQMDCYRKVGVDSR